MKKTAQITLQKNATTTVTKIILKKGNIISEASYFNWGQETVVKGYAHVVIQEAIHPPQ